MTVQQLIDFLAAGVRDDKWSADSTLTCITRDNDVGEFNIDDALFCWGSDAKNESLEVWN